MAERSLLLVARVGVLYHSNRREPVQTHWTVILNTEGDRLTKVKEVDPSAAFGETNLVVPQKREY